MKFDPKYKPENCISKDPTRPHLSNVFLDVAEKKMVATSGSFIVVIPVSVDATDHKGAVSAAALAAARKIGKANKTEAEIKANGALVVGGDTFARPDGSGFPHWRSCIPERRKLTVSFNAKLLLELARALGSKEEIVTLDIGEANDPIIVYGKDETDGAAYGVLMPRRI